MERKPRPKPDRFVGATCSERHTEHDNPDRNEEDKNETEFRSRGEIWTLLLIRLVGSGQGLESKALSL